MNVDQYLEQNPQRFAMIGEACKQLAIAKLGITKATLSAALPDDFALDDSDPWRMIAAEAQRSVADGTMTATEAPDTAAPVEPVADNRETLAARKLELERKAGDLRGELTTLTVERANARARFADALQEYLSGLPKISAEQNAREFIASSIAERAKPYAVEQPTFGPSRLDRQRGYSTGGKIDDRGAGRRPGTFPAAMKNATLPRRDA